MNEAVWFPGGEFSWSALRKKTVDIHGAMKYAEDVDPFRVRTEQIGDSVVAVKQHADFAFFFNPVAVANFGESG